MVVLESLVTTTPHVYLYSQLLAYNDCLYRAAATARHTEHGDRVGWVSFIDLDEFIHFPRPWGEEQPLVRFLAEESTQRYSVSWFRVNYHIECVGSQNVTQRTMQHDGEGNYLPWYERYARDERDAQIFQAGVGYHPRGSFLLRSGNACMHACKYVSICMYVCRCFVRVLGKAAGGETML